MIGQKSLVRPFLKVGDRILVPPNGGNYPDLLEVTEVFEGGKMASLKKWHWDPLRMLWYREFRYEETQPNWPAPEFLGDVS